MTTGNNTVGTHVNGFIESLKGDILESIPSVSPHWAELNAIATLTTILNDVEIVEKEGNLKLNLLILGIGISGITKSLPMTGFTYQILKHYNNKCSVDVLLPTRSSVEGFIKYLCEKDEDTDVLLHTYGTIIRDEFSGLFSQLRKQGWQSDGMEFISELYDGIAQKRITITHGLHDSDNIYCNMISCSTYHFVNNMDAEFFTQGTGNRILWEHMDINKYQISEIDQSDYFSMDWDKTHNITYEKYSDLLINIKQANITKLYVNTTDGAGELWAKYRYKCDKQWKELAVKDTLGWDFHYIKRKAELVLKISGIYAISDLAPQIKIEDGKVVSPSRKTLDSFPIRKKDMEKAIKLVDCSGRRFKEITTIKRMNISTKKPESLIEIARSILLPLYRSEYKMLVNGTWMSAITTETNSNKRADLRDICINQKWVELVKLNDEIKDALGVKSNNAQVYRYVAGL